MEKIRLGKTDLMVTRTAFGALPVQRRSMDDAVKILRRAYNAGINYFDTAHAYTDSEEKIGAALSDVRHNIIIATKSTAQEKAGVTADIEESLRRLKTDYIDLFQFHNLPFLPDPADPDGPYAAALEAKQKGYIRHIGLTLHPKELAWKAIETGHFETLMFPFSYLATEEEIALVRATLAADMGFIVMKGLAGGLLSNARACYAYMRQFPEVVPIWGIQTMEELEEWLALDAEDPAMDDALQAVIEADRKELAGSFCRSCGYCMPCPQGIEIRNAARINRLLRRSPWQQYCTPEWREKMDLINTCTGCRQCVARCPYGLDIPNLLKFMLDDYNYFYEEHKHLLPAE